MPQAGKRSAWVIAAMAIAMVSATAGCTTTPTDAAPAATASGNTAKPTDLQGLLVSPLGDGVGGKHTLVSFKEALSTGLLMPPSGQTFAPDACVNFQDIGDPTNIDGYLNFNESSPIGKSHGLGHDDFFAQYVVRIPGAQANLEASRKAALSCGSGVITLEGKVSGAMINAEAYGPELAGAKAFYLTQILHYRPTTNQAEVDVLKLVYGKLDSDGGVLRVKHNVMVVIGDLLYFGIVGDPYVAIQMAKSFHERAVAKGFS